MNGRSFRGYYGLVLLVAGCQPPSAPQEVPVRQVYDYSISVEETAMSRPLSILAVETGVGVPGMYRDTAHALLLVYETIKPLEETEPDVLPRVRLVPQDTLAIRLTRHQTDTIYTLARSVFMPPAQPPLRDSLQRPSTFPMHDTDPYVLVRLRPNARGGPYYQCSGYREDNLAGYTLRDYLLKLKRAYQQRSL